MLEAHEQERVGRHPTERARLDHFGAVDRLDSRVERREAYVDFALRGVANDNVVGVDIERQNVGNGGVEFLAHDLRRFGDALRTFTLASLFAGALLASSA